MHGTMTAGPDNRIGTVVLPYLGGSRFLGGSPVLNRLALTPDRDTRPRALGDHPP